MRFLWANASKNEINNNLTVYDMCHDPHNLPMDGAIAELNGIFGPKTPSSSAIAPSIGKLCGL